MKIEVQVKGLVEILKRMAAFPAQLDAVMAKTLEAVLLTVHENVLPYPPEPPNSTYTRTGTLGRSLGAGGTMPDIYEVRPMGAGSMARFGTRLEYAPYVIGDRDSEQAWMHKDRWWTLPDIAKRAEDKIKRLWNIAAEQMERFISGGGVR